MKFSHSILQWAAIFLLLLFFPSENRFLLFDTKHEDWYGEIKIELDNELYVLAKNSADKPVGHGIPRIDKIVSLQAEKGSGVALDEKTQVLPKSLVIMYRGSAPEELRGITILDKKHIFQPGNLSVLTTADFYWSYMLIAGLLIAFMSLGFLIAKHGVETGTLLRDKE